MPENAGGTAGTFSCIWPIFISLGLVWIHWLYPFSISSGLDSKASAGKIGLPSVRVRPLKSDRVRFTSSGASVSFPLAGCVLADTSSKSMDASAGSCKSMPEQPEAAICQFPNASPVRCLLRLHFKALSPFFILYRCCLQACHVRRSKHIAFFTSSRRVNLETATPWHQQRKLRRK